LKKAGPTINPGQLTETTFVTADGTHLALSKWPASSPKAVLIALHGFNDYRLFFKEPGQFLSQNQILCYSYDQRGFGNSHEAGFWAGQETYAQDLILFIDLIKARHPSLPIYLLGESMGGAVIINTMNLPEKPTVDGLILSAPAVWGRTTMPWYQTSLLWLLAHTTPWLTLTGEGIEITPSDNTEMLIALGRDPLVIKETRVDAIYGLTNLMDSALDSADKISTKTLLLYGEKDEIVPLQPIILWTNNLASESFIEKTFAIYQNGYHMLLRDLQATLVWQDIVHWINSSSHPLPSGADKYATQYLLNRIY
jgi:alpha-beta hydrolase superfamily lysophospholipase